MVRALIFDFDGLMVDTEMPVFESWQTLYQDHGHTLTLETYVQCVGATEQHFDPLGTLASLVDDHAFDAHEAERNHRARVRGSLVGSDTLPGIRERIGEAEKAGIRLAVASSSPSEWIEPWLERLGLRGAFEVVRTRDMVREAKPSPELFLTAAEGLGVAAEEAIVFEDSHNGLRAAGAAGMPCVIIPNGVTRVSDFSDAALVLESLADCELAEILRRVGADVA